MAEASQNVKALITAAVVVIIVAALISALATEALDKTTKTLASETTTHVVEKAFDCTSINDSNVYQVNEPPNNVTWKGESADCAISGFILQNASGHALTLTTDYSIVSATAGTYKLVNNTNTVADFAVGANVSKVYYYYCEDDYLNSSWGRTLLDYAPGFIAIALLVAVIGITYLLLNKSYGKD